MTCSEILQTLTRNEKIALCSGADFWHTKDLSAHGLPAMMMCDGPHGLRYQKGEHDMLGVHKSEPAVCFPTAVTTACSWDPALLAEIGAAIAEEAKANGVGLVLGPGVNLKRDPLCGRNFEYFSEDPYLAGKLAAGFIRGAEQTGVGTSLKHFALNSQEYRRLSSDSQVDERTMRELYLTAFEIAVKEGRPATVMCAYNKLGGVYCSDHRELLTGILREEWGFDGLVVTDWGAMNDRIAAMKAGCDLMMPGGSDYMEQELEAAVADEDLDRCALRVLKLMERAKETLSQGKACGYDAHHELARRAAAESAVLLKNQGILPLSEQSSVALIGHMAEAPRYQGAGSSHINPTRVVSAREAMPHDVYAPGCCADGSTTDALLSQAAEAAKAADTAVVFAGLTDAFESEGFDREALSMPEGHVRLIETVAAANPNTVVVLSCGSVVECPWADKVRAILYMGLAGQASGQAAADLLYGSVNPSGRLAETWPLRYEDCPTADCYRGRKNAQYREGVYVGYRYYDKAGQNVRWPFGHGLSYTSFAYSGLTAEKHQISVTVTNTGNRSGAEVVQLYILPPQTGLHRPTRELKGFAKVFLEPGESKTVTIPLTERSFALWQNGWVVPGGGYGVQVGDQQVVIHMDGPEVPAPAWQTGSWYENPRGTPTQTQWEALYGKAPEEPPLKKGSFTMEHSVSELKAHSRIMALANWGITLYISSAFGWKRDYSDPQFRMLLASSTQAPIRSLVVNSGFKSRIFKLLLKLANGRR